MGGFEHKLFPKLLLLILGRLLEILVLVAQLLQREQLVVFVANLEHFRWHLRLALVSSFLNVTEEVCDWAKHFVVGNRQPH